MTIAAADRVLVLEKETGRRYVVRVDGQGARQVRGLGVINPDSWKGKSWGAEVKMGDKVCLLLRPSLADHLASLARKAQIITPKDLGRVLVELGIGPGDRVFESGIGSGAATTGLAWMVGDGGKVVVQELREDFRDWARDNLIQAGLADRVEIFLGDSSEGLARGVRGPFDAALLDLPEPWLTLPHLVPELGPGARVACYCPQANQMEEAARTMSKLGFLTVHALELIERDWEVKERGARPSFEGLGHTGFLVFGRWPGSAGAGTARSTGK